MSDAARAADPDIQLLIHPLLRKSFDPSIPDSKEQRIIDSTGKTRGEEQRESQQCRARNGETQRKGNTDHESVMEPIVETERTVVDPDVIEVEGKTEIGRCPVWFEGGQILELRKGQPEIRSREDHDKSIM